MSIYKHHVPSTTSLSDDADDVDDERHFAYLPDYQPSPAQWSSAPLQPALIPKRPLQQSPISHIPPEVLISVLKHLHSPRDLFNCLRVSRAWCECTVELLWHKPAFPKYGTVHKMASLLRNTNQTFTYARFIRRLNFLNLGSDLRDNLLSAFAPCDRLERLTLIGCQHISGELLSNILPCFPNLVAIDLTGVVEASSQALIGLATVASRLQGINLAGCEAITDAGIIALARSCPLLRRVKLSGLVRLTDESVIALAESCPMLLELDLNRCSLITDASVRLIWTNLDHMREMRLSQCNLLTDAAFPSPLKEVQTDGPNPFPNSKPQEELPPLILNKSFEHLRMLDLTACAMITDDAVEGIISHAPKIRNLVLSKCTLLSDRAVESICNLGRHLHYLHLGHARRITDRSVRVLARSCVRIRYIDFANCEHLTDLSVFELSNLPKLRRVGLVRVNKLTDEGIYALAERHATLERIHLSYCDQISVMAIHFLLLKLHKLTHLSLTGVPSFRQPELQQFCREVPRDFNTAQRMAFCVYSGKGVSQLRTYLTELFDRITEMNHTDDTEYEEEYDGAEYHEDTPEPEDAETRAAQAQQSAVTPSAPSRSVPTADPDPVGPSPMEEDPTIVPQFQRRQQPARANTFPLPATLTSNPADPQPLEYFGASRPGPALQALDGNNMNMADGTSASATPEWIPHALHTTTHDDVSMQQHYPVLGRGQQPPIMIHSVADAFPLVESPTTPSVAENNPLFGTQAFLRHFQDVGPGHGRPMMVGISSTGPGRGVMTPDLNYAEIGHGRVGGSNLGTTTAMNPPPAPIPPAIPTFQNPHHRTVLPPTHPAVNAAHRGGFAAGSPFFFPTPPQQQQQHQLPPPIHAIPAQAPAPPSSPVATAFAAAESEDEVLAQRQPRGRMEVREGTEGTPRARSVKRGIRAAFNVFSGRHDHTPEVGGSGPSGRAPSHPSR